MKKILLVEDDEIMLRMYKKFLAYRGFEVFVAINGEEGLQQARQIKPDLIILDVMMPKMNGLELLHEIKNDESIKHIPTVMLTNLDMQHEINDALAHGASLYIVKNQHEPQKVVEMVQKLLQID